MSVKFKNARMLYRYPGSFFIHDDKYDFITVEESEKEKHLKDGWFLTIGEAKASGAEKEESEELKDDSPPTREEMEEMATKLGVRFDGRTSDDKLAARIENAMRTRG